MTAQRIRRLARFAVLVLFVATICAAQTITDDVRGRVEGVVIDGDGKPLPNAIVTAYDSRRTGRSANQYDANDNGKFSLPAPEGKVWLLAHKDSEGYPYAFFSFYLMPGQEFPTVEVKAGETTRGVVVRVGVKAARLNYEVTNEEGKVVLGGFVFERLDQPNSPFTTSAPAEGSILVPLAPFRATFEAKGYKPWHYGGEHWQDKQGIISLKSEETLNLSIRLERLLQ